MIVRRQLRPTRRGVGAAAVVGLALALGATFGMRSLGAVVVPGTFALLIGAIQVVRADAPRVVRSSVDPGFPGERRTIRVSVDSNAPCRVVESIGDGLSIPESADGTVAETVGHGGHFEYTVELDRRGEHRIGPTRCRVIDSFGLFSAVAERDDAETVLVYPTVYEIDSRVVSRLTRGGGGTDRSTFQRLREYTTEDTMRDIHWRASAKRPDDEFLVAEYGGRSRRERVRIVGESEDGAADAMASALASIATEFDAIGRTVTVVVADGECTARPGGSVAALRLLARTDGGTLSAEERDLADVYVRGRGDDLTVTTSGERLDIDPGESDGKRWTTNQPEGRETTV
ncbi:DUF58 domain-containing protein [Natronomonas sp.]|uniref:DUF58 domain-containing protein n=1 Tax=Natronomonas sp. TaxID=2184060 RepID=UPI0039767A79